GLPIGGAQTFQSFRTVLGSVSLASGAILKPGSKTVTGTLTVRTFVEKGGAIYNYFTHSGPQPYFLFFSGDLDLTNVNTIQFNGAAGADTVYPLIQYGGNFNGSLANLIVVGATGSLSNNATTKTISLVTAAPLRGATNVVWTDNAANNV